MMVPFMGESDWEGALWCSQGADNVIFLDLDAGNACLFIYFVNVCQAVHFACFPVYILQFDTISENIVLHKKTET